MFQNTGKICIFLFQNTSKFTKFPPPALVEVGFMHLFLRLYTLNTKQ